PARPSPIVAKPLPPVLVGRRSGSRRRPLQPPLAHSRVTGPGASDRHQEDHVDDPSVDETRHPRPMNRRQLLVRLGTMAAAAGAAPALLRAGPAGASGPVTGRLGQ